MASAIQHPRSHTSREYDSLLPNGTDRRSGWYPRYNAHEATQLANTIRSYTRGTDRRSGWHPRYNVGGATQLANTIRSYTRGTDRRSGWHPRYNAGRSPTAREYDSLLHAGHGP